jgi:hypothetical protein
MTIDNLPFALPRGASVDFGNNLMKKVLPLIIHDDEDDILLRATITDKGKLTAGYHYLTDWVNESK